MIRICLASNYPVIHFGVNFYFSKHQGISVVDNCVNLSGLLRILNDEKVDVLILDLELEGLSSILDVKSILRLFPDTKIIIYGSHSKQIFVPNAIKAGVAGFLSKNDEIEVLETCIVRVYSGEIVINDIVSKDLALIAKKGSTHNELLYKKLSNREIEVLYLLSKGRRSNEIAAILNLNERTISTYKTRVLVKLNVTNLIDLINKAKTLEII